MNSFIEVQNPNYVVEVGTKLLDEVVEGVAKAHGKVLVVHQAALQTSADALTVALRAAGVNALQAAVPDGEEAKRIEVVSWAWELLGQNEFARDDAVIGFGGGAVTDLAGFIAATWLRGIAVYQVPTTLLGMVDAAIGGKTGINTSEGKNLVGAFHAPRRVFCDLETLATLPRNELLAGYGEVVKYGFIADERILQLIEEDVASATNPKSDVFAEIIERCIRVKAEVVSADFKESDRRETLNYGHTLGHAIELTERFAWRHGAAVSVGMVFAAELAHLAGNLSSDVVDRHRSVLSLLGLPISYRADKWEQLLAGMHRDKKSRSGHLRFIVLDGIGKTSVLNAPAPELLFAAYQEIIG